MKKCAVASGLALCLGIEVLSLGVLTVWGVIGLGWFMTKAAEGGAFR